MLVVEYDGVELDHCAECEGTWFDQGELSLLLAGMESESRFFQPDILAAQPEAETKEKKRKCPICGQKMRKVLVGPEKRILIDTCPKGHGLWFDRREVVDLAQQIIDATPGASGEVFRFMGRVFRRQRPAEPDRSS
jgi:Zn-finger nucleic acid-binding protein